MRNLERTPDEILHIAKEAVRNRYQAQRLIQAIDPTQPEKYDRDLEKATAIIGLAFYSGWKFACSCCRPKMWAHFENIAQEQCQCGCGNTLEHTVSSLKELLEQPLDDLRI